MTINSQKRAAAQKAADLVTTGMTLGLGTGSTAAFFVNALGEKVRDGMAVTGIPTSEATRLHAQKVGIEIVEPDETTIIDLAVDGTDELDPHLNLIKGGGGALLREKIIAEAAREFVIIADASKKVTTLGAFPLPIEIENFSWALTVKRIRETLTTAGFKNPQIALRHSPDGEVFLSDGGNLILDCKLARIEDPAGLDQLLQRLPGIIETGLFIGLANRAIIATKDGVEVVAL